MSMTWLQQESSDQEWELVDEAVATVVEIDELEIEDEPEIKDEPKIKDEPEINKDEPEIKDEPKIKDAFEIAEAVLNALLEADKKKQTAKQKPADPLEDWGYSKCRVCKSTVYQWSMLGEFCSHACRKKTLKTFHQ